jgi:hypothetical protein
MRGCSNEKQLPQKSNRVNLINGLQCSYINTDFLSEAGEGYLYKKVDKPLPSFKYSRAE